MYKDQKDSKKAAAQSLLQEFQAMLHGTVVNFRAFQDLGRQHLLEIQELQSNKIQLTKDIILALHSGQNTINPPATPGTTPTVQIMPREQKSGKMPYPEPLIDGVSPFINDWLASMRTKLLVNTDWYPMELERMAYIFDRCGTEAKPYVRIRRNPQHIIAYITAEEMFDTLKKTFSKPKEDREQEAQNEYYQLFQGARPFV